MMRATDWIEHWNGRKAAPAPRGPQPARRGTAQKPPEQELILRELLAEAHARIRTLESAIDRLKTSI
jgi:hypothetical protein